MWRLAAALLLLGPGPDEVPPAPTIEAPSIEAPSEAPIEGPAEPGIEFAIEPPSEDQPEAQAGQPIAPEPTWPTPGTAPGDGWGFIVPGLILMPTAALATWALSREVYDQQDKVAVFVTGGVLGLLAIGGVAMGVHRQVKLKRWTLAYRVVAPPQGSGMLAAAGIALTFGVTLIASGAVALNRGYVPAGATMIGVGVAGLTVVAPLTIHFGKQRRDWYQKNGGWYRPQLPTVELAPRLIIGNDTVGLGVVGRF
ncbi:MAG TPA: hypothetical protein VK034_16765 [Enhygromyxa sp.]|nr:hypothetical protein [Enhygromyxa sp.]